MKFLKKVVLCFMAVIGLLLALAGALIGYYMIQPAPLLSTLASLLLVIGLVSFALAFAEVNFDHRGAGMPTPERC